MPAREFSCKVIGKKWLTPTVVALEFEPSRKFRFEAGQFLSVVVPNPAGGRPLRRAYSFARPPEEGFGLCIKHLPGGPGSSYLAALREGDSFKAFAPYGDFLYEPRPGRMACFISTGTGVAPFVAMLQSPEYRANPPLKAFSLFGARTEDEIVYPGLFASLGLEEINAISQPRGPWNGFKGRVTDYLKSLPSDWGWHSTDFYICGNGDMVAEVHRILKEGRGVPDDAIHQEVYFVAPDRLAPAALKKAA